MSLSRAIRIYEHTTNRTKLYRDNFNWWHGMNELDDIKLNPSFEIFAIGSEEGAMAVHYRWKH